MRIDIPDTLMKRVKALCEKRNIGLQEFIIDAITDKLEGAHKERRNKKRL